MYAVGMLPTFTTGYLMFYGVGIWVMLYLIWEDGFDSYSSCCALICATFCLLLAATAGVALGTLASFIFFELFCHSFIALAVFGLLTGPRFGSGTFNDTEMTKVISNLNTFINHSKWSLNNKNNDRIIRILSINVALAKYMSSNKKLANWITGQQSKGGIPAIRAITYSDIRNHSRKPNIANIIGYGNIKLACYWTVYVPWNSIFNCCNDEIGRASCRERVFVHV
jgi:hypothetical protein